jgi:sugar phosphate isomerase/epimerase
MNIVISALHFDWQGVGDCLATASGELGLAGVEFSWHDSFQRPHCTREDLAVLAARRERGDMRLSAHVWDNLAEADPVAAGDSLLNWLDLCRKTGVTGLVIHGGSYADQKEGIARTRHVFERVLPAYERAGVVLNLENHYAYDYRNCHELFSEPWEFREVLNLDSPSLRFLFDTGHGNMTRNSAALLAELAPWLNYIHLADNHGVDDDHVPYRCGTVAWDEVFDQLQSLRYDGTFCVEFPVHADRAPFRACVAVLRRRWAEPLL